MKVAMNKQIELKEDLLIFQKLSNNIKIIQQVVAGQIHNLAPSIRYINYGETLYKTLWLINGNFGQISGASKKSQISILMPLSGTKVSTGPM